MFPPPESADSNSPESQPICVEGAAIPEAPAAITPADSISTPRTFLNISLVGFMGVGKSTVGHLLADLLGFELIDTDKVIEQRQSCRIGEIFAQQGEAQFRRLEADLVAEMARLSSKIFSTGGGTIMNAANLESLRRHSLIVCLWASPETIYDRVRNQTHRPLLQTPDPLNRIQTLLSERTPVYRSAADIMVGVDYKHAPEVARHIAKSFSDLHRNRPH